MRAQKLYKAMINYAEMVEHLITGDLWHGYNVFKIRIYYYRHNMPSTLRKLSAIA